MNCSTGMSAKVERRCASKQDYRPGGNLIERIASEGFR